MNIIRNSDVSPAPFTGEADQVLTSVGGNADDIVDVTEIEAITTLENVLVSDLTGADFI